MYSMYGEDQDTFCLKRITLLFHSMEGREDTYNRMMDGL